MNLYSSGVSLESIWDHFGTTFGIEGDFGSRLAPCWGHFGATLSMTSNGYHACSCAFDGVIVRAKRVHKQEIHIFATYFERFRKRTADRPGGVGWVPLYTPRHQRLRTITNAPHHKSVISGRMRRAIKQMKQLGLVDLSLICKDLQRFMFLVWAELH